MRGRWCNRSSDCGTCTNCVIGVSRYEIMSCETLNKLYLLSAMVFKIRSREKVTSALVPEIFRDRFEHSAFKSLTALGR